MPKRRNQISWIDRIYLINSFKGIFKLMFRFFRNLFEALLLEVKLKKSSNRVVTIQYPDQIQDYPSRFRGRHRLTLNERGEIKCTSCFLCSTACPAKCIYIEPAEHPDPEVEKFPHRYEIDTLLCIYCGFCVEACPVDAIRMDTGLHPEIYRTNPNEFIEDKETLMLRSLILEKYGVEALRKFHLEKMKKYETNELRFMP